MSLKPSTAVLLLCAALAAGCNMIPNLNGADRLSDVKPAGNTGIVILSTGAPERCISTATFLKILPEAAKYSDREVRLLSVDGYAVPSDFTTHHGYLNAVVLPAGRYYLTEWIANPYVSPKKVAKADFSVAAGETVYLGEFFKPVSCTLSPHSEFRDRQERDMELLLKKNPRFDRSAIVTRITRFSGYAVGGAN